MTPLDFKLPGLFGGEGEESVVDIKLENFNPKLTSIGSIISFLLPYILVLAGLVMFIFLIIGGLGLMTSAGNPEKMKAAQGKITSAVIGFVIIFISYWLARILEILLGISILG